MVIRRLDAEIEANMDARGRSWALPMPGKRFLEDLRASAALPAAGAYELTNPIEVWKSRLAHLYISVDAAAIGNRVSIIPELSMDPNGSDDSFFTIGITDGSVSPVDLGVTPGGTYSEFNFGAVNFLPMEIRTAATDNATDTIRMSVTIDVNQAYWIRFRVAEFGVLLNPSVVKLQYAKSV